MLPSGVNQVVGLSGLGVCPSCNHYLFFLITANVDVNESVAINTTDLSCNIAQGKW